MRKRLRGRNGLRERERAIVNPLNERRRLRSETGPNAFLRRCERRPHACEIDDDEEISAGDFCAIACVGAHTAGDRRNH